LAHATLSSMSRSSDEAIIGVIQRLVGHATTWGRQHPLAFDGATAVVLAGTSLVGLAVQGRLRHADTLIFCVLLCVPLALRTLDRRLCFAAVSLVALIQWLVSTPQVADGAVLVSLFWIALDGEPGEMVVAAAVVEAGAVMAALRWSPDNPTKVWVGINGLAVAAGALGLAIRERRALADSTAERTARLEFERDQEGRLGAAAERARIAREMHDIVSHNLTVMIGLADGASYALQASPDSAQTAMHRVSETGRQALEEMRRLLGVLHEEAESGPYEPQPGLDRLDDLLARVESAGIPVSIELEGDIRELSSGVQLTIFRVAQEALTNTLKHAPRPTRAHLALRSSHGMVTLEITDSVGGPPPHAERASHSPTPLPSGGRGLRGMRERAVAYGGQLEAGPLEQGGWRVLLTLGVDVGSAVS
jgi:signal transduction histidine kinase